MLCCTMGCWLGLQRNVDDLQLLCFKAVSGPWGLQGADLVLAGAGVDGGGLRQRRQVRARVQRGKGVQLTCVPQRLLRKQRVRCAQRLRASGSWSQYETLHGQHCMAALKIQLQKRGVFATAVQWLIHAGANTAPPMQ